MPTTVGVVRSCWKDILAGFLAKGFTEEEIAFEFNAVGAENYEVVFSNKLYDALRRASVHNREHMCRSSDLDVCLATVLSSGKTRIAIQNGWAEISLIQCAISVALNLPSQEDLSLEEEQAAKRTRIIATKDEVSRRVLEALNSRGDLGVKGMSVYYKKGYFHLRVRFRREGGRDKRVPVPFEMTAQCPESIIMEFRKFLESHQ